MQYQQAQYQQKTGRGDAKDGSRVARAALVLGWVAIIPVVASILVNFVGGGLRGGGADVAAILNVINVILMPFTLFAPLAAIGGIITGVLGKNSAKRKAALTGVILSAVTLALVAIGLIGILLSG